MKKRAETILPPPKPKPKRELPLSKRFPDAYCHKTKIWIPPRTKEQSVFYGGGGGTIEVTGCLPDKAGELVLWLVLEGKKATDAELTVIVAATTVAANRIRAEREKAKKDPR